MARDLTCRHHGGVKNCSCWCDGCSNLHTDCTCALLRDVTMKDEPPENYRRSYNIMPDPEWKGRRDR